MGIKTSMLLYRVNQIYSLKNLPTTWGLRLQCTSVAISHLYSEKPPHHMGIKTYLIISP